MTQKGAALALVAAALLMVSGATAAGGVERGRSGWEWGNPLPQGHALRAVAMEGATGYAAGDFGTLLRTDDGGSTWTDLFTGVTADLQHLALIDADSLVVAGRCALLRSDDGGLTFKPLVWTASDGRCPVPIAALAFVDDQRGYLVLADGSVLRSDDGGSSWTPRSAIPVPGPTGAAFTSADAGVVTTAGGLIYRTVDGGNSWTAAYTGSQGLRDASFAGPTTGYAVGDASTVLRTTDAGKTWTLRSTGGPPSLESVRCVSALVCLATADDGRVVRTADGGKTLTPLRLIESIQAISFGVGNRTVGVGEGGAILMSDDGGVTWSGVGRSLPGRPSRLRASSPALALGAGPAGCLVASADGGRTWQAIAPPTRQDMTDVSFANARVGYALDLGGQLFRTGDGGTSWSRVRTGLAARPQAVLALGDVVLLVGPHSVFRSSDGGRTFAPAAGGAIRGPKLFEIDRAGRALFVYGSRRIAVSTNEGRTWKTVRRPRYALIESVDFVSPRTGYLLEQGGHLWRTSDGGRRWHDLAAIGSDDGIGIAFASASTGYLAVSRFGGDAGGYVLHTTNGGRTWQPELLTTAPLAPAGLVARGRTVLALATDGSIFYDSSPGLPDGTIFLRTRRRALRHPGTIRITGSVPAAMNGSEVVVARRVRGDSGWDRQVARVGPGGFTTTWRMTRTATFVAQWIGDAEQAGGGSRPLRVEVRRRGS